jgi:hypothetical protein
VSGLKYVDRVQETSSTSGTSDFVLAGAVTGYQAFSSAFVTGEQAYYSANDGTNWEVGLGTYTLGTTTLARTQVLSSSAGGTTKASFSGTVKIWVDMPAEVIADRAMTTAFASHVVPQ